MNTDDNSESSKPLLETKESSNLAFHFKAIEVDPESESVGFFIEQHPVLCYRLESQMGIMLDKSQNPLKLLIQQF